MFRRTGPTSAIFDQLAGNLFVTRIASNTAVPAGLASLDFAIVNLASISSCRSGNTPLAR